MEELEVQLQLIQQFKQALIHFNIKAVVVFLLLKANKTYLFQIFRIANKNFIVEEEVFRRVLTQELKKVIKNLQPNKDHSIPFSKT